MQKSESEVAQSGPTFSDPMTAAYQAPLSMGFSRPEYWSGVPLSVGRWYLKPWDSKEAPKMCVSFPRVASQLQIHPSSVPVDLHPLPADTC